MMKIFVLAFILSVTVAAPPTLPGNINTVSLDSSITFKYSITSGMINIQVMLTNQGAIAVGLGGNMMAGVDVAHFWWDGSKVNLVDRNYIKPTGAAIVLTDVERGGSNDFVDNSSTFDPTTGNWVATFSRKLNTGDIYDNAVTDGGQIQIAVAKFGQQTWGQRHTNTFTQTVKLTSSANSQIQSTYSSLLGIVGIYMALLVLL
ncbi:hypothetical protein ABPG74_012193 [Tetrahymena malaccensis]